MGIELSRTLHKKTEKSEVILELGLWATHCTCNYQSVLEFSNEYLYAPNAEVNTCQDLVACLLHSALVMGSRLQWKVWEQSKVQTREYSSENDLTIKRKQLKSTTQWPLNRLLDSDNIISGLHYLLPTYPSSPHSIFHYSSWLSCIQSDSAIVQCILASADWHLLSVT